MQLAKQTITRISEITENKTKYDPREKSIRNHQWALRSPPIPTIASYADLETTGLDTPTTTTIRFISRDPIRYRGSKWNLYEYVAGKPTKYLDPSGLRLFSCCNGKTYEPAGQGCSNKKIYSTATECCEGGEAVSKVPIWTCAPPNNDVPDSMAPVICLLDIVPGVVTQPFGCRFKHSYVCIDGPNENCWGIDSNCSISICTVDWSPYVPKHQGPWKEKIVCPEKRTYSSHTFNLTYGFFYPKCSHHSGTCGEYYW